MVNLNVFDTKSETVMRTIEEIQQEFAENSGYGKEVIWDLLSAEQGDILRRKIKEFIPDREKGQTAVNDIREALFQQIWAQRKYTNLNSLSAIIFVLVTKKDNLNDARKAAGFSCHPVFRTRKCVADSDSSNCCMIFIDETGRAYQNWKEYLSDNVLPNGTMVVPRQGIYTFDGLGAVNLDVFKTPANSVLASVDTGSAIAGALSACVPIAAILTIPVAAPVMLGAAAVGMVTAGYAAIRSGWNLVDRTQHEQSISLADRQARNSWLGVAGGVVGVGAAGATRALSTAAAAGREISVVTELAVNGMNISSIVLSSSGIANGVLDLVLRYNDDEDITTLDLLQLSASLVLFTHSVRNFRLASSIVNSSRNGTIQTYRKELSNRQRRMFDKMSKETIRMRGQTRGKIDIIRSVNDIPSKQYLNDLYKINKQLNQQKVRPAFGAGGGGVVLNNEMPVDTQALRNNVDMLSQVTQPIPSTYNEPVVGATARLLFGNPIRTTVLNEEINPNGGPSDISAQDIWLATIRIGGNMIALSEFSRRIFDQISNRESFESVVTSIADLFGSDGIRFFMKLAKVFFETILNDIQKVLKTFISSESVLYHMLVHCLKEYSDRSINFLESKSNQILESAKAYFLALSPNNAKGLWEKCKHCPGKFNICNL